MSACMSPTSPVTTQGQFACQQCKQPIYLDSSLVDLAPSAYDILQASLPRKPHNVPTTEEALLDRVPASNDVKEIWKKAQKQYLQPQQQQQPQEPEQSYVLLPQRQKQTSLSHQIRSHSHLFSLLSSHSDIDHPLCEECAHLLLSTLTKKLEETKRERDGYIAFEREIRKERGDSKLTSKQADQREEDLDTEIERLKAEEQSVIKELKEAEARQRALEAELAALEEEERALEAEEVDFFHTYNAQTLQAHKQESTIRSLSQSLQTSSALLASLERANVYNDAFCIGLDGAFGTINGLRFGRSSGSSSSGGDGGVVEWAEVNAAWGLAVLCLVTIARKLDYHFETYTLQPLASISTITYYPPASHKSKTGLSSTSGPPKGETYELHGSGDLHLGRILHNRRFDTGMVFYLDALRLIIAHVKSLDPSVEFPHTIVKDKIGDVSIKLQFSQEEVWTRALRHVLLALKILLKWMTNG